MEFVNDLINGLRSIVTPEKPRKNLYDEIASETRLYFGAVAESAPPAYAGGADSGDDSSEKPLLYETDEAANRAFLAAYWIFMTNYYGRPPQFRSDLFCAMFPMDVLNRTLDPDFPIRYWWFSIQHPIAKVLERNGAEVEGPFDSGLYGICCICRDEYIEMIMDWIVELTNGDESKRLDMEARSAYSKDRDRVNPILMEQDDDAVDEGEDRFVGAAVAVAANVGSKKDD